MTLPELLQEARRIAPNMHFEAWDRRDYEVRTWEVIESRETRIDVTNGGHASQEGIVVTMKGDEVERVTPGTTVAFWQADPVMRAWRSRDTVA